MHEHSSDEKRLDAIRQFIDEKIAPGVLSHGGEVIIQSIRDNVLYLTLSGSCGSCGVQSYTSESIANIILDEFEDLDDVLID